jgi:hypothetical protein
MRVPTIALVTTFVAGSCGGDSFEASYIGCFHDQGAPTSTSGRDLSGYAFQSGSMTIGACISECQSRGFAYAGVQYSTWCFCGNSYGRFGTASNCTMSCGGDSSQTCGGSYANSVYSTNGSGGSGSGGGGGGGTTGTCPTSCPAGSECVSFSGSLQCAQTCTSSSQCASGCCDGTSNGSMVCAPSNYCGSGSSGGCPSGQFPLTGGGGCSSSPASCPNDWIVCSCPETHGVWCHQSCEFATDCSGSANPSYPCTTGGGQCIGSGGVSNTTAGSNCTDCCSMMCRQCDPNCSGSSCQFCCL